MFLAAGNQTPPKPQFKYGKEFIERILVDSWDLGARKASWSPGSRTSVSVCIWQLSSFHGGKKMEDYCPVPCIFSTFPQRPFIVVLQSGKKSVQASVVRCIQSIMFLFESPSCNMAFLLLHSPSFLVRYKYRIRGKQNYETVELDGIVKVM